MLHSPEQTFTRTRCSGVASYGERASLESQQFYFISLWSKCDSQLSRYCVVFQSSLRLRRCQQLTYISISTALVTKPLVIEQLLHPALESTVSAP